jgi:DNA invertase Pin-like site-specific DNA recombinase
MAEVVAACPPEGWPSTSAAAATLGVQPHKARTLLWQAQRAGLLEAVEGAGRTSAHRWHVAGSGSHDPAAAPDPGREARREAAAGLRRQGLSYNAIARALGVSAGTAYADVQKHGAGQG